MATGPPFQFHAAAPAPVVLRTASPGRRSVSFDGVKVRPPVKAHHAHAARRRIHDLQHRQSAAIVVLS